MSKYILQIYRNIKKQTNLCHLGWYQKVNFRGPAHGLCVDRDHENLNQLCDPNLHFSNFRVKPALCIVSKNARTCSKCNGQLSCLSFVRPDVNVAISSTHKNRKNLAKGTTVVATPL